MSRRRTSSRTTSASSSTSAERRRVVTYESFGVVYRVELGGGVRASDVKGALPPGTRLARGAVLRSYELERDTRGFSLSVDGDLPRECATLRDLCDAFEGDVALFVAAQAPAHVFIHAGAVVWKGRAMLFPGPTMTGKSTMVAALVKAGATYYSDEYAVIDVGGRIVPYPRPISLRQEGARPMRTLPRVRGRRPAKVGWVFSTAFSPKRAGIEVDALRPGEVALLLLSNAVAARVAPRRVLAAVRGVADVAAGRRVQRGEAAAAVRALLLDCDG